MFSPRMRSFPTALALVLLAGSTAHADYQSATITLDHSNQFADGVPYGSVKLEAYDGSGAAGGSLNAGEVRLTYTADHVPLYGTQKPLLFGFLDVGFNTDLKLTKSQIHAPLGWSLDHGAKLDGFGHFSWEAWTGTTVLPEVSLLVTGLSTDATLEHFLFASTGKTPQGSVEFAGRVLNFATSRHGTVFDLHWIGGGVPGDLGGQGEPGGVAATPEPSAFVLGGFAFFGVGVGSRLRTLRRLRR